MALNALTLPFGGFGRERMWQKRALEREIEGAALRGRGGEPTCITFCALNAPFPPHVAMC